MNSITLEFDDNIYQPLMEQVGKENLNQFFIKLVEPYLLLNQSFNISTHEEDSIFGFTKGDVKILGDVVSPTSDDNEWDACQ